MKRLRTKRAVSIILVLAMIFGFSITVGANVGDNGGGPAAIPGGPMLPPEAERSRDAILTFEEVEEELFKLEEQSKRGNRNEIDLQVVGYSGLDRPLYAAVIGEGEETMWIQGRIHGDEPYGAEACLDLLRTLIQDTPEAEKVLEEMTLLIIPVYNPDGNVEYQRGDVVEGIDLNRDWNITFDDWLRTRELVMDGEGFLAYPWEWFTRHQAVESQNFYDYWLETEPDYAVDIHHWGTATVEDTDEMASLGIGIPVNPAHLEDEIWDQSRQLAVAAYDAAEARGWCNPVYYGYIDLPSAVVSGMMVGSPGPGYPGETWEDKYLDCVNALGGEDYVWGPDYEPPEECECNEYESLDEIPRPKEYADVDDFIVDPELETAAMFLETNFQEDAQVSRGYLIRQNIVALWGMIDAIVADELGDIDPDRWDELPDPAGREAPWEDREKEDERY